jgi:2-polyprenyl-6-methoxyphenol hydroxylase-like FAD-dependent oxidoreductase
MSEHRVKSQRPPKVLIAGAGIGGLTSAIALDQAGCDVQVCERADELRPTGAGLHLWSNATRVLDGLGLGGELRRGASLMERAEFRRWQGDLLASWPVGDHGRELDAPSLQISRQELHRVLCARVRPGVLQLGRTLERFTAGDEGVVADFTDGTREAADVLIGADGIRSVVRAQLLGDGPPREAGYTVWRGVVDGGASLVPTGSFCSLWGRGERFVFYDLGHGALYWMSVSTATEAAGDVRDALLRRHRGWMAPIEEMIAATPRDAIHRTVIIDRPPAPRWGEGRVTLLGDAAHPMTFNVGQGACQAIEDAAVLARVLAAGSDTARALREYEALRRERTAKFQALAWRLGRMGRWRGRVACGLRDRLMALTYDSVAFKQHRAAMEHAL